MPILNPSRILNNLIVVFVLGWIFFLIWARLDQEQLSRVGNAIKRIFNKND